MIWLADVEQIGVIKKRIRRVINLLGLEAGNSHHKKEQRDNMSPNFVIGISKLSQIVSKKQILR